MFFDEKASIQATQENAERELGRVLTDEEKSVLSENVSQGVAKMEISTHFVWLIVIAFISVWILDKFTGAVSAVYVQHIEPYALWMIADHTDSILNLALQCYLWGLLVPIALALVAIFLPTALATFIFLWLFGFCAKHTASGDLGSVFLWGLPALALLPCIILVPVITMGSTLGIMCRIVFPLYFRFHAFLKDKVLRIKKLTLGKWILVTHVLIPACLIILVMLFATDKSHLTHRTTGDASTSIESSF